MFDRPLFRKPRSVNAAADARAEPAFAQPSPAPLGDLLLRWQSVVGKDRRAIGCRVLLQATPDGSRSVALETMLDDTLAGFVGEGSPSFPHGMVILAVLGAPMTEALMQWTAPRNVVLEVEQVALDDAAQVKLLFEAQRRGVRLALRLGGQAAPVPDRLQLFHCLIGGPMAPATVGVPPDMLLYADPQSQQDADAALAAGQQGVIGWPLIAPAQAKPLEPMQRAVLEMIRLVQSDADVSELERGFRADPVLAFMLLNLTNSPAFVRAQAVSSISQAILVLGYARLVKWLVLLLVVASKENSSQPAILTAITRGFCMEFATAAAGGDRIAQDDAFVVGAFSLLDVVTGMTPAQLFSDVAMPEHVVAALAEGTGPCACALALARAFECADTAGLAAAAAAMRLPMFAANGAMLRALAAADAMQATL